MPTDHSLDQTPVRSPCVSICALDEADVCIGCQRSATEISRWSLMNNAQRRAVLLLCDERAKAGGLMFTIAER